MPVVLFSAMSESSTRVPQNTDVWTLNAPMTPQSLGSVPTKMAVGTSS